MAAVFILFLLMGFFLLWTLDKGDLFYRVMSKAFFSFRKGNGIKDEDDDEDDDIRGRRWNGKL